MRPESSFVGGGGGDDRDVGACRGEVLSPERVRRAAPRRGRRACETYAGGDRRRRRKGPPACASSRHRHQRDAAADRSPCLASVSARGSGLSSGLSAIPSGWREIARAAVARCGARAAACPPSITRPSLFWWRLAAVRIALHASITSAALDAWFWLADADLLRELAGASIACRPPSRDSGGSARGAPSPARGGTAVE